MTYQIKGLKKDDDSDTRIFATYHDRKLLLWDMEHIFSKSKLINDYYWWWVDKID